MGEALVLAATLVSAFAAACSVYVSVLAARISRDAQLDQQRSRLLQYERERYQKYVGDPAYAYLTGLMAEWYPVLHQGLADLDALVQAQAPGMRVNPLIADLTFALRQRWRLVSSTLMTGAEVLNPALLRQLEAAHEELEDEINDLLEQHRSVRTSLRVRGNRVVLAALEKHRAAVLRATLVCSPETDSGVAALPAPRRGHAALLGRRARTPP